MPRPGETPSPAYERGTELPYGVAAAANRRVVAIEEPPLTPEDEWKPATPTEAFLFSPTDRPDEPATHGAPFGPGAAMTQYAYETTNEFVNRALATVEETGLTTPGLKEFFDRVRRGE